MPNPVLDGGHTRDVERARRLPPFRKTKDLRTPVSPPFPKSLSKVQQLLTTPSLAAPRIPSPGTTQTGLPLHHHQMAAQSPRTAGPWQARRCQRPVQDLCLRRRGPNLCPSGLDMLVGVTVNALGSAPPFPRPTPRV